MNIAMTLALLFFPLTAYATQDFNTFVYLNFKGTAHFYNYDQDYHHRVKINMSKYLQWLNYTPTFFNIYLNSFNMVWYPDWNIVFKLGFDETKIGIIYHF